MRRDLYLASMAVITHDLLGWDRFQIVSVAFAMSLYELRVRPHDGLLFEMVRNAVLNVLDRVEVTLLSPGLRRRRRAELRKRSRLWLYHVRCACHHKRAPVVEVAL